MAERPLNFYAGPAILPLEVLRQAREELLDFNNNGLSILEISHRSKDYAAVNAAAEADLKEVFSVPDNYRVLFLQGGASLQFGMVPMNFLQGGKADYVNTGAWAKKAIKEAKVFGQVHIAASAEDKNFSYVPDPAGLDLTPDARYVHITSNETISGTQWNRYPDTGDVPLVADMSSDILCRKIPVEKFALIYAGAQKNLGPAGVTVVIIRDDMLELCAEGLTTMLSYRTHAEKDSLYNTPPVFSVYLVGLVLKWIKNQGGLAEIESRNREKAARLYETLDGSDFFRPTAAKKDRSLMNVTFRLPSEELEAKFIAESSGAGMVGLKGHRSVGGIRASIYNAFPPEGVDKLIEFMKNFEKANS